MFQLEGEIRDVWILDFFKRGGSKCIVSGVQTIINSNKTNEIAILIYCLGGISFYPSLFELYKL